MVTAGSIISGAFRVLHDQPKVFAIWAAGCLAATIASGLLTRPMLGAMMAEPAAGFSAYFMRILPVQLAMLLFMLVLFTAAQRAILRPSGEERLAYLRLGMDELRVFLLALILTVLVYLALGLTMGIAVALVAGLAATAGMTASALATALVVLLLLGLVIWLEVRLSLAFPLTLLRRKIIIGESWRLTRGRFWTLFGGYLVIALIAFALSIVASAVTAGSYWLELMRGGFNPQECSRRRNPSSRS
jgi:hypothetical protein